MPADKINRPFKIILSSGPRGGKSVISKKIAEWFSDEYLVFVIPETARELFDMGLIFDDNPYEAQKSIIRRQLIKEKEIFDKLSTSVDSNKTIVVFDRTCIDAGTFLPVEEFSKLLQEENLTKDICELAGVEFNIKSPKQMQEILDTIGSIRLKIWGYILKIEIKT